MESLMTEHCTAFAARAAPFLGAQFGMPSLADLASDPAMVHFLRERAMLLGIPPTAMMMAPGAAQPPPFSPTRMPPGFAAGGSPQTSPPGFWSKSGNGSGSTGAQSSPVPGNGQQQPSLESLNEIYNMQQQQQQWYSAALAAARNGQANGPAPPQNIQNFAAHLAATNPQLLAAAMAYANNNPAMFPNGGAPMMVNGKALGAQPLPPTPTSPTLLKPCKQSDDNLKGKEGKQSPLPPTSIPTESN